MIKAAAEAESRGATGLFRIHHVIPAVAKNNQYRDLRFKLSPITEQNLER